MSDLIERARSMMHNDSRPIRDYQDIISQLLASINSLETDFLMMRDQRDKHKATYDHAIKAAADILRRMKELPIYGE